MTIPNFYPNAAYVGSPNFGNRGGLAPEAVVLHIAAGSMAGVDSWFNTPSSQVSAHFCVGKDGTVHQYVYLPNASWSNGVIEAGATAELIAENGNVNPNRWTVSVEHEGQAGDTVPLAQIEASTRLTAWLFTNVLFVGGATGVAVDRKHILRHADISPITRPNCPGWSEAVLTDYIARVKAILSPPAPAVDVVAVVDALNAAQAQINRARTLLGG